MGPMTMGTLPSDLLSLPVLNCTWSSASSSWIYQGMENEASTSDTLSPTPTLASSSSSSAAISLSSTNTSTVAGTGFSVNCYKESGSLVLSSSSSWSSSHSSFSTLSGSAGHPGPSLPCNTLLTQSLSETPSVSNHRSDVAFTLVWATAAQLWKDNPERDLFNTFSVSERDLTCAITHLETQLGARQPSVTADVEEHEGEGEVGKTLAPADGELPFRIKFILDSYCNVFWLRKQDLRELKVLQKQEQKQYQDLLYKNHVATETQDRKFEAEMQTLIKNYEQDMDTLTKQQKQAVEKAELAQQHDLKTNSKRIKQEQEKEFKKFREKQKQEMKLVKQELDMMPKGDRETIRRTRESKELELHDKERVFLESQTEQLERHMRHLAEQHRQKIALLESQFLQQKQQLLRAREAAVWEMEKEQLHEKHQLAKGQLKDMFFLKRHQMLTRHEKEMDQMKSYNSTKEEEMQARHTLEKRRLPKILKAEAKTRAQMFKQSLQLSKAGNPEEDKMKMKQFDDNEKRRMKAEMQRQESKHRKQWEELQFKNQTSVRELEQLQAEKRKLLMEQETQKIKELDEQYATELKEWKTMLIPRKQKLEEEFFRQKEAQTKFYGSSPRPGNHNTARRSQLYPASSPSTTSLRSKDSASSMSSRHSTLI